MPPSPTSVSSKICSRVFWTPSHGLCLYNIYMSQFVSEVLRKLPKTSEILTWSSKRCQVGGLGSQEILARGSSVWLCWDCWMTHYLLPWTLADIVWIFHDIERERSFESLQWWQLRAVPSSPTASNSSQEHQCFTPGLCTKSTTPWAATWTTLFCGFWQRDI